MDLSNKKKFIINKFHPLEKQIGELPTEVKWCKKCVISNQRPRIVFNVDTYIQGIVRTQVSCLKAAEERTSPPLSFAMPEWAQSPSWWHPWVGLCSGSEVRSRPDHRFLL